MEPCQPEWNAHDKQTLFAVIQFSACQRTVPHHDPVSYVTKWILWMHIIRGCHSWYNALQICIKPPFARSWIMYHNAIGLSMDSLLTALNTCRGPLFHQVRKKSQFTLGPDQGDITNHYFLSPL